MAKLVERLKKERKVLRRQKYDELMEFVGTMSPELVFAHKELSGTLKKPFELSIIKIGQLLGSRQKLFNSGQSHIIANVHVRAGDGGYFRRNKYILSYLFYGIYG
jgi:hypothetical protein